MFKVAIIQFPGSNCEYETRRAALTAGLDARLVRWNEDYEIIRHFDAYILPGGFSYEDRVRSGAIAARDPIMNVIRDEAEKGKPVLGICNGAQILVEAGMIPGISNSPQPSLTLREGAQIPPLKIRGGQGALCQAALAANNNGWLNIWVSITNDAEPGCTPFNNYARGHHFRLPIAHGEGRFVIPEETLKQLIANGQTVFRYCDTQGNIKNEFPVNPNGAVYNLAGVSNPQGNVLALMPHPERVKEGQVIFESLKKYLEHKKRHSEFISESDSPRHPDRVERVEKSLGYARDDLKPYTPPPHTLELYVDLIITDNEAVTLENAFHQMGFTEVKVAKKTHWEIVFRNSPQPSLNLREGDSIPPLMVRGVRGVMNDEQIELMKKLITSGELLNTKKEIPYLRTSEKWYRYRDGELHEIPPLLKEEDVNILVRYNEDYEGVEKTMSLQGLGFHQIPQAKKGIVWQIEASQKEWEQILEAHILFNPYSQNALYLLYE